MAHPLEVYCKFLQVTESVILTVIVVSVIPCNCPFLTDPFGTRLKFFTQLTSTYIKLSVIISFNWCNFEGLLTLTKARRESKNNIYFVCYAVQVHC